MRYLRSKEEYQHVWNCNECGQHGPVVEFTGSIDDNGYEDRVYICRRCLTNALTAVMVKDLDPAE